MSLSRKCDRCGSFYIPESRKKNRGGSGGEFNAITLIDRTDRTLSNKYYENRTYDLCPNCSDSLINWLNNDTCKEA